MSHHELASRLGAMGEARGVIRDELTSSLRPSQVSDAELMTSELVANAIQHADADGGSIGLDIGVTAERVRIAVTDAGSGFEVRAVRRLAASSGGWGLALVDRVSDRWGIRTTRPHTVWFEIDRT